jgi:hypothetical protein
VKVSAFNELYIEWIENGVEAVRLFASANRQRKMYRSLEFSRITCEQFMRRPRLPQRERITRWFTECGSFEHKALPSVDGVLYLVPINQTTFSRFYGLSLDEAGIATIF